MARVVHDTATRPLVAIDADLAGQMAAQRDFWLLSQHAVVPESVQLRPGSDPAQTLETSGPAGLRDALARGRPLAESLLDARLTNLSGLLAVRQAVTVLAAGAPQSWQRGSDQIAAATAIPLPVVRRALADAVTRWDADPRRVAAEQLGYLSTLRARTAQAAAAQASPTLRPRATSEGTAGAPTRASRPGPQR